MYFNRPPYFEYEGHKMTGLLGSILNKMLHASDIKYDMIEIPARRQIEFIKQNKNKICGIGWFKNKEREKFAKFTKPIYKDTLLIGLALNDNKKIGEVKYLKDILTNKNITLLVKKGFSYGNYLDKMIKQYNPNYSSVTIPIKNIFKMLCAKRIDYFFISTEEAIELIVDSQIPFDNFRFIYFMDIPKGNKRYLMCSKSVDDDTIQKLNIWIDKHIKIEY
jgi:uncharacterized protein (TIGR02285 family)